MPDTAIAMIARVPLDLEGDLHVSAGEQFAVSPVTAAQLIFAQTARFAEPHEVAPVVVNITAPTLATAAYVEEQLVKLILDAIAPPPAPTPRKRRTYRRRDLTAQR